MNDLFRWLAPPALVLAGSSACYAVQYLSVEQAQKLMFPDAGVFQGALLNLTKEQIKSIEQASGVRTRVPEQRVWRAEREDKLLGYFIVDEVIGKHELITYAVALSFDGKVRQVEVLEYRESHGYEIRNPRWRAQFVGKTLAEPLALDQDIKNISGATLSCRHVTEGVKRLLALHQVALK